MQLITKQTDYAIRILATMAKKAGDVYTTTSLSSDLRIPKPFVRAILQNLNKKHIVASSKGKGGGFRINKPAGSISVVSVIEIFQGPVKLDRCMIRDNPCPDIKTCILKKSLKKVADYINEEFKSLTIADIAGK